jgi:hypothetical protein
MDITPALRKAAMHEGFPQFKHGGRIAGKRPRFDHKK